jgi:hypothetical protein
LAVGRPTLLVFDVAGCSRAKFSPSCRRMSLRAVSLLARGEMPA